MSVPENANEKKIAVVGGGSWGTALANLLAEKGYPVSFWVYEKDVMEQIANERENKVFLPGNRLSKNLYPSNDLRTVVSGRDIVLIVTPSHVMRDISTLLNPFLKKEAIVISASKGIENVTHLTMSGVLKETLEGITDKRIAVLSGPSFAREVVRQAPTVVSVASGSKRVARLVQKTFATSAFRVYTSNDIIGVELGGAVKNVIAIASGIVDGLGLGLNTRAALITRGMTELRRMGLKLGANPRTFSGPAGVGDMVLTCTGSLSRNHTVGKKIGQGQKLPEILSEMRMVAEGVKTAKSVYNFSRRIDVEMPISEEVYNILYKDEDPKKALYRLMTRDLKNELDDT